VGSRQVDALYEEVAHPIDRLEAFLDGIQAPIEDQTASTFVSFLRIKIGELREMAREIDEK
jgi:hypothetical protein